MSQELPPAGVDRASPVRRLRSLAPVRNSGQPTQEAVTRFAAAGWVSVADAAPRRREHERPVFAREPTLSPIRRLAWVD